MGKAEKTLRDILSGASDANIAFSELRTLLTRLGFTERVRGDHFVFAQPGVEETLNLQPIGVKAKPYQVK